MFAIRCLTSGEFIRVNSVTYGLILWHTGKIPADVLNDISVDGTFESHLSNNKKILRFEKEESAQWFINRRLTYNPKRKDYSKLTLMESIFTCNDLPEITVKVEFETVEIE